MEVDEILSTMRHDITSVETNLEESKAKLAMDTDHAPGHAWPLQPLQIRVGKWWGNDGKSNEHGKTRWNLTVNGEFYILYQFWWIWFPYFQIAILDSIYLTSLRRSKQMLPFLATFGTVRDDTFQRHRQRGQGDQCAEWPHRLHQQRPLGHPGKPAHDAELPEWLLQWGWQPVMAKLWCGRCGFLWIPPDDFEEHIKKTSMMPGCPQIHLWIVSFPAAIFWIKRLNCLPKAFDSWATPALATGSAWQTILIRFQFKHLFTGHFPS